MMHRLKIILITLSLIAGATVNGQVMITPQLKTRPLALGAQTIQAEIAATPSDRQQGLMFRTSMPANHGMLFIFEESASHCFWMRNTPLPLSIGYFNEAGVLINTADMAPFNDASHCPTKPAKYALEMNQGWFAKHHIKPGSKITGLPKL